jgi:ankyrin repeat protein
MNMRLILYPFALILLFGCSPEPLRYENIYDAIAAGDAEDMERHLDKGTPIETGSSDGWTPLMAAVRHNCYPCAKELLSRDARTDITAGAMNPLHVAVYHADIKMISLLLKEGLDINQPDTSGAVPLFYAILKMDTATIAFLIDRGANPDGQPYHDTPLLSYAAGQDSLSFECLLQHGASLDKANHSDWPPLHVAALGNDIGMMERLIALGIPVDWRRTSGGTALYMANILDKDEAAQYLLDRGADADQSWR